MAGIRRSARWGLGAVCLGAGLIAATWLLWPSAPQPPPVIDLEPTAVHPVRAQVATTTQIHRVPSRPDRPPVGTDPKTPHEEAMMAAIVHSKEGFVRCVLPPGMEVDVEELNWAGLSGRILTMATTEPAGQVPLTAVKAPDSGGVLNFEEEPVGPVALAVWSDGYPGQEGSCEIQLAADQVDVEVWVVRPDGTPAEGAYVSQVGAWTQTDGNGRAVARLWAGRPAEINVFYHYRPSVHAEDAGTEAYTELVGTREVTPRAGEWVRVHLGPPPASASVFEEPDANEILDSVDAQLDEHDAYLHAALKTPGLSAKARAQIEHWLDRSASNGDEMYELLGHLVR